MSGGRQAQLAKKEGAFIDATQREVYESLAGDRHFKLFMGWLIQRCGLTDAIDTNNGSEAFKIIGRRQIAVETMQQIEKYAPEFYEAVLEVRREYRQDLKRLALTPEEELAAKATEEED